MQMGLAMTQLMLLPSIYSGLALITSTTAAAASSEVTGLRMQGFGNAVLLDKPACTTVHPTPAALRIGNAAALAAICPELDLSKTDGLFSARFHGQLNLPPAQYQMKVESSGAIRLWVHGWKLVDDFYAKRSGGAVTGKYNFTVVASAVYPVRIDTLFTALPAAVTISYRAVGTTTDWKQLPSTALSPMVDPNEQLRQDLQTNLSSGWNTWHRAAATAHVHLPSAFGFDFTIVDPQLNTSFTGGIRCKRFVILTPPCIFH
jgi:hypothetical protein